MRTVPRTRRRRAASFLGVPVVLALVLGGCAPSSGDGGQAEPGAAPTDTVTTSAPSGTASDDGVLGSASDDAAQQQAEQDAADQKASDDAAKRAEEKKKAEAAEKAKKAEEKEAAEKKAAEEAAAQEAAEQKAADEAAAKKAAEARDKLISYGDSGAKVTALQERLQELGYFLQDADGTYGPATQQAVWALQKAAGQYRDGVVGPKTQAALDDGVRPRAHSSSGKAVEIDLDRQLLMTVENGKVTRIFNASSGNGDTYEAKGRTYHASTPRGSFAVYMERNGMHESTLELGSMYRPKYFSGGYAVHGSSSIPPFAASHGCVRVSNAAINWLWDSWGMPKGTPVILY
ncbi:MULTISPECIES: L,D-transpeptidase family protein [unclassified Isoptericola]|uniref:L,D-transpeptidase family protein n=1 Tax=unclassified Isoptericola TaxID=2623355 RepID=UPI0036633A39